MNAEILQQCREVDVQVKKRGVLVDHTIVVLEGGLRNWEGGNRQIRFLSNVPGGVETTVLLHNPNKY
jgi:hypothetical protein